jgi:hypothetical protein
MKMPKKEAKRSRARGLSCGQMILIFLLVVIVALGAAVALGFALGIFERTQLPFIAFETQVVIQTDTGETAPIEQTEAPTSMATTTAEDSLETPTATMKVVQSPAISPTPAVSSTPPPTAPADVCAQVNLSFVNATSNVITWRLGNSSGQPFVLDQMDLVWPKANDAVFNVFVDGRVIWSGEDLLSPTFISSWLGDNDERTITGLTRLEILFGTNAAAIGYDLTLRFENGCEVSVSR